MGFLFGSKLPGAMWDYFRPTAFRVFECLKVGIQDSQIGLYALYIQVFFLGVFPADRTVPPLSFLWPSMLHYSPILRGLSRWTMQTIHKYH